MYPFFVLVSASVGVVPSSTQLIAVTDLRTPCLVKPRNYVSINVDCTLPLVLPRYFVTSFSWGFRLQVSSSRLIRPSLPTGVKVLLVYCGSF